MATSVLVDRDLGIGRRVLSALARAHIPVTVAFWAYVPQATEWQLFIGTPLVDSKGHKSAYQQVLRTLQSEGFNGGLPWRRIFLRSPKDSVLKVLEKKSKAASAEVFTLINDEIGGRFVEDVYLYSGFIHIAHLRGTVSPPVYSVMFAPYNGPGGIVPSREIKGNEDLREFLRNRVHVDQESLNSALDTMAAYGSVSIPNIQLKHGDLKRLGLA